MKSKIILILLSSFILSGCFKKMPKKKPVTPDPVEVEVPIPTFGGPELTDEEVERIQDHSFRVSLVKNITMVGDDVANYVPLNVIPNQLIDYSIVNNNGSLGRIAITATGSFYIPGNNAGTVTIKATNGVFSTTFTITVNGKLIADKVKVATNDDGTNFVKLKSTGGMGGVTYSLVNDVPGKIVGDKFYPIKFEKFYQYYLSRDPQRNYLTFQYKATDAQSNTAIGEILIFPKMLFEFKDNENNDLSLDRLEQICSNDDITYNTKDITLSIFGGIAPYKIIQQESNEQARFHITDAVTNNFKKHFIITAPTLCNDTKKAKLTVMDFAQNTEEFFITRYQNLKVVQSSNEITSSRSTAVYDSVDSDNSPLLTTQRAFENPKISISGGKQPYTISDENGTRYKLVSQGNNLFEIEGLPKYQDLINLKLYEGLKTYSELSFSQESGILTTVSSNPLNAASLFSYLRVTPGKSQISFSNESDIDDRNYRNALQLNLENLNYYNGDSFNSYNQYEKDMNVSAFFAKSLKLHTLDYAGNDTFNKKFNFEIIDDHGALHTFSKNWYNEFSFYKINGSSSYKLDKVESDVCINCYNFTLPNDLNSDFISSFESSYRAPSFYRPFGDGIVIGQEQFSKYKLTGGINGHNVKQSYKFSNVRNSSNREVQLNYPLPRDFKTCSLSTESYGHIAYGSDVFGVDATGNDPSTITDRNGSSFNFQFDFSGLFQNVGYFEFNNYLRTVNIPNWDLSVKHKIYDNSADPENFLFRMPGLKENYFSDVLETNLSIGSSFEYRKRPITLPPNATNIKNIDRLFAFEIRNSREPTKVCLTYVEDYSIHYDFTTRFDDNQYRRENVRFLRRPEDFEYIDNIKSICINGTSLKTDNNNFYFLDENKYFKTIKLTTNGIQLEENKEIVRSGLARTNIDYSPNLYRSYFYEILSVSKIDDTNKVAVVRTNFSDESTACNTVPYNEKLGIYFINGSIVTKRIFDYYPMQDVNKNSQSFISPDGQYVYVMAIKKDNCEPSSRVILKISKREGIIDEIVLNDILHSNNTQISQFNFFDMEILTIGEESKLYLSGVREQFVINTQEHKFIDNPFLIGIDINNFQDHWYKQYRRDGNSCIDDLQISEPHIVNYKSNNSLNQVSLLFNLEGKYLKGGSFFPSNARFYNNKDIGRLEINSQTGNPLYFRRFESLSSREVYKLAIPDTNIDVRPQLSIIKVGSGLDTKFYEIPYYTDK